MIRGTTIPYAIGPMYIRYQTHVQPCFVGLHCQQRVMYAQAHTEIGNAIPISVINGFEQRFSLPAPIKRQAAIRLLARLEPLAETVCSGFGINWDGDMVTARFSSTAQDALLEMAHMCDSVPKEDYLVVRQARDWYGWVGSPEEQAAHIGINADMSDVDFEELVDHEEVFVVKCTEADVVEGLEKYLRYLRNYVNEAKW